MQEIQELLEKAGLSPGETKVYLSLVELGLSSVGPIVSKSGVSTSKVYSILNRLSKKGLVSSIVNERVKNFKAEDPSQLIEYVSKKEDELEEVKKSLEKNLSYIFEKIKISEKQVVTTIYEGLKGMKTVFDQSLKELKKDETLYVNGVSESTEEIRTYFLHYFKKQLKIGFKVKSIFDETAKYKANERKNKLSEFRFLPRGIITPATIDVYHNKTIISVGNPSYILTIVINNKEIANSFKENFNAMWKLAKK
ncbi:MAG: helix-turn-helix domain-containing protein [Nanoarchaeota archaeon]|nr:helix-turn-helix domain-containing protein [Nanoarchaeota archaeon]